MAVTSSPAVESSATLSPCGTWRYRLVRRWASGPGLLWVLLNPATADATTDDPTTRRVMALSAKAGWAAATVTNLYALRSTNPDHLAMAVDPVGPDNDEWLATEAGRHDTVVVGWGSHVPFPGPGGQIRHHDRIARVEALLKGLNVSCYATNVGGHPRHPLYLPTAATLRPYQFGRQ